MTNILLVCCFVSVALISVTIEELTPVDNDFRFTSPLYNVSIPENSVAKTYASPAPGEARIGIKMSKDVYRNVRYKIVGGDSDKFFKADHKTVGDFSFLYIRTRTGNNHVLNRERRDKYILEIRASAVKGHNTYVQTDTLVVVTILDTNDLNPLFYPTEYNVTVFEDTPVHQSILKVVAEDADLGRNGEIYYSFLDDTDQFTIHPITGVITLSRPLRYNEGMFHDLTVQAQDRGAIHRTSALSRAKVKVRVKQVNFFKPEIRVRHHPQIVENSNADIYAIVSVVDKDSGIHGQIKSLDIVDGDPDGHFRIRPTFQRGEYNIEVLKLLDREKTPQGYTLQLRAVDRGVPPKESYKSVPVQLSDLNDNAPVFNKEIYEVKVPETAPVNTPLIRLKVSDADEGKNAQVFLEIVGGNEGGEFHINPETGMLYTAVPLDAETKSVYSLTVSAIDQGNVATRKQSSAKVKIYVEDTNDNDPIFDKTELTVWIDENMPAGSSVTTVRAKDKDRGENAYISYLIANLVKVPFEVDHFSGVVKTTQLLDYESMRREYVLRVRASDWGLPYRRQTEMQLTVKVKDINDNRPQFEKIECTGHVPRYSPIGSEIITLSAIDFDSGNIISYRIVSGNEDNCFTMDQTSGTISVSCDLADIRVQERELNVTATDGQHFADIARIHFKLVNTKRTLGTASYDEAGVFECKDTGVARRLTEILSAAETNNKPPDQEEFAMMPTRYGQNVHAPEFIEFPIEIKVNESVALGTTLIKLKARDRDLGYNGKLIYGISGGDEHSVFCLDMDSGELKVIGYLDRERESEYLLNVSVYDLGKPQKSASRMLPITVLDINDNAPKFEKSIASFRVTENALNGTTIFRANATDADTGDNAKITYSLVTDTKDFAVDKTTGALTVSNNLDRERQEIYELRIRATDGGGKGSDYPPLYSEALVRITIDDINDNPPKFSLPSYSVKIREDIPKGSVVAIVSASDPDLGPEGEIVYSLEDTDSDGTFKIDRLSGTIRTTKLLDFEERQMHSLMVIAKDRGNPSLSSEVGVTVDIVDVNENMYAPQFSDFVLEGAVMENRPPGTVVMTVNATDNDPPGEDSRIEYSIRGGDGLGIFIIDNNGTIKTAAVLDVETKSHYWLTVFAQDHGVVPLFSSVEVYIEVQNENDNIPLSKEAVYYASVPEDSPSGRPVIQVEATDNDVNDTEIEYKIITGNVAGLFQINSSTGLILTTQRRLDRESQDEYILEVQISDKGSPPLSSTTRVVVTVEDINDNAPEFDDNFYKVQIPASADFNQAIFQNDAPASDDFDGADAAEDEHWETFSSNDVLGLDFIFRALAFDKDEGKNSEIHYSIKSGKGRNKFKIDNVTGMVYAHKGFEVGQEYDINIKATDNGEPAKGVTCRLSVSVVAPPAATSSSPTVQQPPNIEITENDVPGYLVTLLQASDPDGDVLWYDIVDGDPRNEFYIGRQSGNILLAKQLDYETQKEYQLNISVTDAVNTVYTQLNVSVLDQNDHRPEFTEPVYKVEISESVSVGTEILQLQATDADNEAKLVFSLHAARNMISLQTFKIDSISGSVTLSKSLDRESLSEHLLTVMVRDSGTPSKRNYARVLIIVHDQNDHTPQFSEKILEGKVFESASVGSAVLRAFAVDHDKGENARVTYSISSGNVGNVFSVDPDMGIIQVARELDISIATEYTLYIRATDHGQPSLSTTIPAHIMLTMSDNAPPKFVEKEVAAEIFEDQPLGGFVALLKVRSTSSLQFEIVSGNVDDAFMVSPSTGVIITQKMLDYETVKFYNLTIKAINMASASATGNVIIHVLDKNDNVPQFEQETYSGSISESAPVHSLILTNTSDPLVIKAHDADSEINGLLHFDIVEILPRRYFQIDSNTGAIRTIRLLDHETFEKFTFHVTVSDLGNPKLSSETTARVDIMVTDVNDCPPIFEYSIYNVTLLLPTYKNVAVIKVNATDRDTDGSLKYDIIDGNKHKTFDINSATGLITVLEPENMKPSYKLQVRVSDGKFSSVAKVYVRVEQSENSGLTFQKAIYEGSIVENTTKINNVCVVNVLGSALNEHLEFRILNPTNMFKIGLTSGVISTTGIRFDRETKDNYELIVEARSHMPEREKPRVAHVIVNVTVLDVNDNCPMFVNLPYYAVVSVDDEKGSVIAKVHAIDMDSNENGEVRYELIRGHGELFKVQRETGAIEIKQSLEGHNREYELEIAAYDKGITPCRTDVKVYVKVIDRSMPVFKKQFYSEIVQENVELHSPLGLSVQAESPLGRKLIYSIVKGNELEEFALDFNTAPDSNNGPCVISVVDELDYEQQQQYELVVRATDSVSGVYAEVPVSIVLQDVNDCPPEFTEESYNISISEAAPFGTSVLVVAARDNDTGINQKIIYSIKAEEGNNATLYFHIDEHDGTIYLKQSLDHERSAAHHFIVMATDQGNPSLSSTSHVWLAVLDMNDNPPKFEQTSYYCGLSVYAKRDQFVTIVSGSDPDLVDQSRLKYSIVAGNEQQTFSMDPNTGIVTLTNLANFGDQKSLLLNVSVSDGVYTNFARLKVELLPANLHPPIFPDVIMDVEVAENRDPGELVTVVKASDKDFGKFATVTYSIQSDLLLEVFSIDKNSGKIITRSKLDREKQKLYEIPVMATDGGDRSGFLTVRVKVSDENDNAPKFNLREYKGCVSSNYTQGQFFLKIHATDPDEGLSAQLRYAIYKEKPSDALELFDIDSKTGRLYLTKDVGAYEGQVFQFFVRATDGGAAPRHSDVPVTIMIMGPNEHPPIFERKDDKFFLSENSPTGTVITSLKMISNISVTYKILSGSEENPMFAVDSQGHLSLARPLNFESQASHIIGILAETDSSPPLTALVEITLQVLDENDNAPHFESSPYVINLAENTEEGTSILKVTAHDNDQGSNGEIRYTFGSDAGDAINVFSVDAFTGWITTLVPLDKETKSDYKFSIMATDNKHTARTTVIIKLKDYNDSPTVFKRKKYEGAVQEDALPGTVILRLETTDADVDLTTPIDFYIISGDPSSHFRIRQTGELYVVKQLDRETVPSYELEIVVTDGLFTDYTKVNIKILDANDNPPYCLKYRYRQVLSEGIHPGSFVLSVLATDVDEQEHSKLRYILTGEGSENFSLDKDSGHLKTITHLDREKMSKYNLVARVQDKEHANWECSSQIELVISDLNDNAPLFSLPYYSVALPEDVEVGTLVTKVHATDADIGINRKIKYSFIDSFNNHFKMAPDSGIVTLAKPLDREIRAMYNLTVQAVDQGTPQLSSVASLIVNVQDINDNPPEFASKYYFATVPEINAIGTEIVRVLATSKDTGVNAEVYYSIIGGNEHRKFTIHNKTGVITLAEMLDYERAKDYFLTIQAIDGGTPPLSNVATVNITVTDCNDNAPVFGQVSYSEKIIENATIGDKVLQVTASDLDSGENGRVSYSIIRGDQEGKFAIDENLGFVTVANKLDRETVSSYVLEILAKDNGLPVLSRQVLVNIDVSDANDNPPLFSQSNYTAVVQEDKPIGYPILKFSITDADALPNTSPYTFDFRSGNEGNIFRLEQDGILRTASKFNHKIKNTYLLQIRVFDNGTPPLYSDTYVAVRVIEESQYPPAITPLEININSFLDDYPGGIIGRVFATDQDQYDTLTFSLSPTAGLLYPTMEQFRIDRVDGTLTALPHLDVGDYRVNVSVTDGKYYSHAIVRVCVEAIAEEMLEGAVVIRFREVSPEAFVLSHRKGFVRAVRNAMNCRLKDVIVISVQPSDDFEHLRAKRQIINKDLDVLFTVKKSDADTYYTAEEVRKAINENLEDLESSTKLVVEEIVRVKCTPTYCQYGKCEDRYVIEPTNVKPISTDVTSFVSPKHSHRMECLCQEGYGGDRCDVIINECARSGCPSYKICIPDSSSKGFSCQCPEGFAGSSCNIDISKCHDESCYIARNPMSFKGKSYSQYRIINKKAIEDQLSLSLRIRTMQPSGNLMHASGKVDYNILEVVNGVVQYRFELGSGEGVVRVSSAYVSDGKWHEIRLERDHNNARLTVDGVHSAQGSAPGISDILNLQSDEMYLGAEVHQHPSILGLEDIQRGFTGCMDDVRIARISVPLHKSGDNSIAVLKRFANVEFSCDSNVLLPAGACGSQPCMNGGTCKETQTGFECICHARFKGILCEYDTDPCSSSPCLYGGKCVASNGDYSCECSFRLSGKRCEYGKYCSPNPCQHGGVCEEGDDGPLCKCRSFTGEYCQFDLNECDSVPCQNGGTCINEIGSFRCLCPGNTTGLFCGNPLTLPVLTMGPIKLGYLEITIVSGALLLIFVIVLFVCVVYCKSKKKKKRSRAHQRQNVIINETRKDQIVLNSSRPHEMVEFKRGKLSNLEGNRQPRPQSYTATPQNENFNYNYGPILNNFESIRSYGSAGDELENPPLNNYVRNLNLNNQQTSLGNCDSDKTAWAEQMHLAQSYAEKPKVKNDYNISSQVNCDPPNRLYGGRSNTTKSLGPTSLNSTDDDQRSVGSYHWDCSDWARNSQIPLPNITEVPGSEIPDSSSFHSNESNESRCHHLNPHPLGPVNPERDIETLNEDLESEFMADSECEPHTASPSLNALDSGNEDYRFTTADSYVRHPNTYLPTHGYNIPSEAEGDCLHSPGADSDDVEPYGFPSNRNRRKNCDDDIGSVITALEERDSLLGPTYGSNSDMSTNLCEIEDSECETEQKPLNYLGVQQTSV